MNVSQLTAMVKAEGADIAEMQLKAVGLASNVAGLAVTSMGSRMKAAGLEFFDFDAVSKEFVSNMAESAGVSDATAVASTTLARSMAELSAMTAEGAAAFRELAAPLTEVAASADVEASAMRQSAGAMLANAEAARTDASATREVERSHTSAGHASLNLMGMLYNLQFAYQMLVGPIGNVVKGMFDYQAIQTQTNAVLKSTKGVSGETASAIGNLAESFSRLTMFSRDTVQEVENILLTFPSIGKKVFPETTQAVLNLSQAMHQNWKQSAIEVGKALDDPIRSLTNLRRIGVQFTNDQVKVIKSLWETVHTAEAQKLILQELNKEFGNSAKAAGQTFGGQLAILGQHLQDTGEKIGMMLMPWLKSIVDAVTPIINSFLDWMGTSGNLSGVLATLGDIMAPLVQAIQDTYTYLQPLIAQVIAWAIKNDVAGKTLAVVKDMVIVFAAALRFIVPVIVQVIQAVIQFVSALWDRLGPAILTIVDFIRTHWTAISAIFQGVWDIITAAVKVAWAVLSGIILAGIDILQGHWGKAWDDIKQTFVNVWEGIKQAAIGAVKVILGVIALLPGAVGDAAKAALKWLDSLNTSAKKSALDTQKAAVANIQAMITSLNTQLENATTASQRHFIQMKIDAAKESLAMQQQVLRNMQGLTDGVVTQTTNMANKSTAETKRMHQQVINHLIQMNNEAVGHSIIPDMVNSIIAWFGKLPDGAMKAISSLAGRLAGFFNGLASQAFSWGLHIIQNLASGILAGFNAAVAAAQAIADAVKRILGHSKPTEGPLKDDDLWGAHFVDNFVRGILAGAPRVQAELAQMLGSAGLPGGGLNLGISGSFSGPSGIASSFGGGSPVIHVHVHPQVNSPIYIDGHEMVQRLGPHLAYDVAVQNAWRRPVLCYSL